MVVKLDAELQKKFEGKSPEDIISILRSYKEQPEQTQPPPPQIDAAAIVKPAMDAIESMGKKFTELEAKIVSINDSVSAVVEKAKTEAGKVVVAAIANTGVPAPLSGGATDTTTSSGKRTFADVVNENMTKGMSKAKAIEAAINTDSTLYAEWRASGSTTL